MDATSVCVRAYSTDSDCHWWSGDLRLLGGRHGVYRWSSSPGTDQAQHQDFFLPTKIVVLVLHVCIVVPSGLLIDSVVQRNQETKQNANTMLETIEELPSGVTQLPRF